MTERIHSTDNMRGTSEKDAGEPGQKPVLVWAVGVLALAAIYFGAAKLGLALAFAAEQVSAVWPPTGIALAAVLLFGYRVWPGIALGAFLANVTANEPVATAFGIAMGNTLEAVVGAWLLRRVVGFGNSLERLKDALGLIVLAAGLSTTVSATIGVTSLCLGGVQLWSAFGSLWLTWWLGDAVGALIVAPVLLTWATGLRIADWRLWIAGNVSPQSASHNPQSVRRLAEALALTGGLIVTSVIVFSGRLATDLDNASLAYIVFPFVIWAALRFGQQGTTAVTLAASSLAIWGTVRGVGPFGSGAIHERLLLLQAFMGVVAITALLLGAALSERGRAEGDVRESEERLRLALHAGRMGTWEWNLRTNTVIWSPGLEAIHGLAPGTFAGTFDAYLRDIHAEDRELVQRSITQAVEQAREHQIEYRVVWADKSVHWVEGRGRLFHDESGQPVRMSGVCVDITARKQDERRLAALHAVTRILAESATLAEAAPKIIQSICETLAWELGAIWQVDAEAGLLRCVDMWHCGPPRFPKFEAITRQRTFPRGIGLPGRVWTSGQPAWIPDVVHDTNFPRGPIAAEEGLHGAFGFPIRLGVEVLGVIEFFSPEIRQPDEDLLRMMTTVGSQIGQVIERKRGEEAVRQSEARKTAVFESALDAIVTINHEGNIVEFNPAAEKTFGYTRAQVIGKSMADMIIPPSLRERHRQGLAHYLATGEGPILGKRLELPAVRANGSEFPAELTVLRIPLPGPPMFTGYIRDITERKRLEQELQRRVQELAAADRRKDEFLATLAHELRNPLAPIRNGVEVMRQIGLNDPQLEKVRGMLERQVLQVTRLVDDLLDVSRITRGQITLRQEPTELAAVVTRAVETSRPLIDARRHLLTVSLPPQPVRLQADPTRLAQVFANLLNNAAKFTKEGGRIWLTAELGTRDEGRGPREDKDGISLSPSSLAPHPSPLAPHEVVVRVRDSGIGIVPEMLPHVFDLFAQGERSLERSEGGLGIGLTLVRSLVELHGGAVQVFSEGLGKGSEFVVRLPLLVESPSPPTPLPPSGARGEPSDRLILPPREEGERVPARRILVVDDNHDAAHSLSMFLKLQGHDVRTVYDGPSALQSARDYHPEAVLLDIGLPGMDGYEVARRIRSLPALEKVLLVAMTGYGQEEDKRRSQQAGFNAHLVKPADLDALRALLATPELAAAERAQL